MTTLDKLVPLGGLAGILSGTFYFVYYFPVFAFVVLEEDLRLSVWLSLMSLLLISVVLALLGLTGLYLRQAEAAGTFGLVAFLVAFVGTALWASIAFGFAYVVPD